MKPTKARDLLKVDAKPRDACEHEKFSQAHLTAYSVHWLTVWEIPSTYENISVLNARLFPWKFTLAGFPEFPDAMCTNREIMHMRPKWRGLATSDPRRGVFLTEKGQQVVGRVLGVIGSPTLEGRPVPEDAMKDDVVPTKRKERTRSPAQIVIDGRSKLLFRRFVEGRFDDTDVVHLLGLVSLYDHTPPAEVRKALRQLRSDAQSVGDHDFLTFLDRVEDRFSAYLRRGTDTN
jgi:hypothetical protein